MISRCSENIFIAMSYQFYNTIIQFFDHLIFLLAVTNIKSWSFKYIGLSLFFYSQHLQRDCRNMMSYSGQKIDINLRWYETTAVTA